MLVSQVSWKAKLYEVGAFLERWIAVQLLWRCLYVIFKEHFSSLARESTEFVAAQRDYFRFTAAACDCQVRHNCDERVTQHGRWLY